MLHKEHDVLIVGSGHAGGMAAKTLTEKGISCLILEAGPEMDYQRDRTTKAVHELALSRLQQTRPDCPTWIQANEFNANQWVDEKEVPYTHPADAWANWVRVRLVGGRSPHFWARQSFRLSNFEFKAGDFEGTRRQLARRPGRDGALLLTRRTDLQSERSQGRLAAIPRWRFRRDHLPAR